MTDLEGQAGAFLAHADKLHALRVIGTSSSLREAASRLGLAPSTLSEKVQALERVFGRALVERDGSHVALTPFAEELAAAAQEPLAAIARLAPQRGRARGPRTLRIGAYDSLAVHVLPRLVRALTEEAGTARVVVQTGRSSALVTALSRAQVDLAIAIGPIDDGRFEVAPVATDELRLARPAKVTAAAAAELVAAGSWVGLAGGRAGHARFYQQFSARAGLGPAPLLACDSFEVIRSVALAAGLPALLPARVMRRVPGDFREMEVPESARAASRHEVVVARRTRTASPVFELVVGQLRVLLGEGAA